MSTALSPFAALIEQARRAAATAGPVALVLDRIANAEDAIDYNFCPVSAVPVLHRHGSIEAIISRDGTVTWAKAEQLARQFAAVLGQWLNAKERAEVVKINAANAGAEWCATHNFCDANVAMAEAFASVMGRQILLPGDCDDDERADAQMQAETHLWNAAWRIAKAAGFWWS